MKSDNKPVGKRPSCIKCIHYYLSYNPDKPYGCRIMGFQSMQNPAVMVFASSRIECQLFQPKIKKSNSKTGSDNSGGGIVA